MLLNVMKRAYCICVVHIYKSDSWFEMFISFPEKCLLDSGLKVTKKMEISLKSALRKDGYSEKVANEIWDWYTCPTHPQKNE